MKMKGDSNAIAWLVQHWRQALEVLATVLVILVCANLLWAMTKGPDLRAPVARPLQPARPPEPKAPLEPISLEGAAVVGAKTATVALIEYSDFRCPFCRTFALGTEPAIKRDYVDTGRVIIAFRHVPLESIHPLALKAAETAECARRQGKFWPMHDLLFQNQKSLDETSLRGMGKQAGLELRSFDACVAGQATDQVKQDEAAARALRIVGTPTFLLGTVLQDGRVQAVSRLSGTLSIARLEAELNQLLNRVLPVSAAK